MISVKYYMFRQWRPNKGTQVQHANPGTDRLVIIKILKFYNTQIWQIKLHNTVIPKLYYSEPLQVQARSCLHNVSDGRIENVYDVSDPKWSGQFLL
jgi:hypothetical protein